MPLLTGLSGLVHRLANGDDRRCNLFPPRRIVQGFQHFCISARRCRILAQINIEITVIANLGGDAILGIIIGCIINNYVFTGGETFQNVSRLLTDDLVESVKPRSKIAAVIEEYPADPTGGLKKDARLILEMLGQIVEELLPILLHKTVIARSFFPLLKIDIHLFKRGDSCSYVNRLPLQKIGNVILTLAGPKPLFD